MRPLFTFIKPQTDKTTLLLFYLTFGFLVYAYAYNFKGKNVFELVIYTLPDSLPYPLLLQKYFKKCKRWAGITLILLMTPPVKQNPFQTKTPKTVN